MALKYTITLPPPTAFDLGEREVTVTIDSNPPVATKLPPDALSFDGVLAQHGQAVAVFLVDIDRVGNRSQPSDTLAFTAQDTIPPQQPGALSVADVVEVPDAPTP